MKTIIISIVIAFVVAFTFTSCGVVVTTEDEITEACEYAYFEGQKDALEGDVRIQMNEDSTCYKWIKTPWDSGKRPIYEPPNINL
jgi:hypothetical protein